MTLQKDPLRFRIKSRGGSKKKRDQKKGGKET